MCTSTYSGPHSAFEILGIVKQGHRFVIISVLRKDNTVRVNLTPIFYCISNQISKSDSIKQNENTNLPRPFELICYLTNYY